MMGFDLPNCPTCLWRFDCPVRKYVIYVAQNYGDVINHDINTVFKKVLDDEALHVLLRCPYINSYQQTPISCSVNVDLNLYEQFPKLRELG